MKRGHGQAERSGGRNGGAQKRVKKDSPYPQWHPPAIPVPAGSAAAWGRAADPRLGGEKGSNSGGNTGFSELALFYDYVAPREVEVRARRAVIEDVQHCLRSTVPGWQGVAINVFGSFKSGYDVIPSRGLGFPKWRQQS